MYICNRAKGGAYEGDLKASWHDLTQNDIAELLGVTRQYINMAQRS